MSNVLKDLVQIPIAVKFAVNLGDNDFPKDMFPSVMGVFHNNEIVFEIPIAGKLSKERREKLAKIVGDMFNLALNE